MAKKYTMRVETGSSVVKTSGTGKWEVRHQGKVKVHTLSKASQESIKKASKTFGPALSRLAHR